MQFIRAIALCGVLIGTTALAACQATSDRTTSSGEIEGKAAEKMFRERFGFSIYPPPNTLMKCGQELSNLEKYSNWLHCWSVDPTRVMHTATFSWKKEKPKEEMITKVMNRILELSDDAVEYRKNIGVGELQVGDVSVQLKHYRLSWEGSSYQPYFSVATFIPPGRDVVFGILFYNGRGSSAEDATSIEENVRTFFKEGYVRF